MEREHINRKWMEKTSLIYGIIVALIFGLSLYIRVVLPYDSVFTENFVRFGGNDPWYKMRLVENTLYNFPHRIYFDAFTYYPHGTRIGYAPLFDYLITTIIWVIGRGNPFVTLGVQGIEAIGAWYPAVLGALTVFPIYFIGKEVWNRNAGLLSAALIAVLPGQFLSRSLLGFTDHHAAETLFGTTAMLFLILAIKAAKKNEITFYSFLEKDWTSLKLPLIYSFFMGFFLGIFFLSWTGAPLFIFILLIYAVVQYVIDHMRGEHTDYLCIIAVPALLIALVMIAPVPYIGYLSSIQVISLLLGIVVFIILSAVSFAMDYKKIESYGYPIVIAAVSVISLIMLSFLKPSLYSALTNQLTIFFPSTSRLTIAEVHPMYVFSQYTGKIADGEAWRWFSTTFFIAFAAYPLIGYNIAKKFRAEELLIFAWSLVILFASFGQNRFAAYYAINVALLCGFVSWKIIEFVGFRGAKTGAGIERVPGGRIKGKKKGGAGGGTVEKQKPKTNAAAETKRKKTTDNITRYVRADLIITVLIIGLIVFYPPLNTSLASAKYSGGPDLDWYESLAWMKNNTPDPGLDYYALYETPLLNETTTRFEDYTYPDSAYSVISWWDYGHWIMRIARRIPVANPFQQGIGGPYQGNAPGACLFFTARNASVANDVADALDVKYVVSDFMMADAFNAFYNKFGAMTVWANDTEGYYAQVQTAEGPRVVPSVKYYSTIEARLHIFDGTGVALSEEFYLEPLRHYRLVHESPSTIITIGGQEMKYVKVFEYVQGATIQGNAPIGSIVEITANVTTNQGRQFTYSERTMSMGSYEFIVPYSTEGPIEGGTKFDVFASPYTVRAGYAMNETIAWDAEQEVRVLEEDVMEGKTIIVDLG
jgi:oligosaccharyl transferase (archaeosortase A-associated)